MPGQLPVSRIKTIMKSSADVNVISKEASYIMTRAAQLFIKHIVTESQENVLKTSKSKKLDYKHVANVVNSSRRYEFLTEIIPHKITVAQYRKIIKERKAQSSSDELDETEESSDDQEDDDHRL